MPRQEFPVGQDANVITNDDGRLGFSYFSLSYPLIDAALIEETEAAYLVLVDLRFSTQVPNVRIAISEDTTGSPFFDNARNLISDIRSNANAITITAGSLSLEIPGPDHSSNQTTDDEEPYVWMPSAAKVTEIASFITAWNALSQADKDATVLALDTGAIEISVEIQAGSPTFDVTAQSRNPTVELRTEIRAGIPKFEVRPDRDLELYCLDPDRASTTGILSTQDQGLKIFVEISEDFNILSRTLPDGKQARPLLNAIPEVVTDDSFFKSASDVTLVFNNIDGDFNNDYIGRFVQIWGMSGGTTKRLITTGQISAQNITQTEARFTVSDIPIVSLETQVPRRIISDIDFPTSQQQNSPVPIVFGRVLRHRCLSLSQGISTHLLNHADAGDTEMVLSSVIHIARGDVLVLSLGTPEQETIRVTAVNLDTLTITASAPLQGNHLENASVINAVNVYDYLLGEGVMGDDNFQKVFRVYHDGRALPELRSQEIEQVESVNSGSRGFSLQDIHHVQFAGWYENFVIDFYGPNDTLVGSFRVEAYDAVNNSVQITVDVAFEFCYYTLRQYRFFDGSQTSPYPGYAFIRLARPYTREITADVEGFPETSPAAILKEIVTNEVWGAGELSDLTVENDISDFKLEGAITRPITVSRFLEEVGKIREFKFFRTSAGVVVRFVTDQPSSETLPAELGDYIRAPISSFASISERTKRIEIQFRRDERTGEFNQTLEETEGLGDLGAVKEIEMPFVYEQLTADRVLFYKKQQVISRQQRAECEIPMSWFLEIDYNPQIGDRITIPGGLGLGDADTDWLIQAKRERCDFSIALTLAKYNADLFNYPSNRNLPMDEDNFKPLTDFSETPSGPVRALHVETVSVKQGETTLYFSDISFIPPQENYSTAQIWLALAGGDPVHVTDEIPGARGTARIDLPLELPSYEVIVYSVNEAGNLALLGYPVSFILNQTPVADAGADQTVAAGASVTLDGSGSSDPDNDPLSYLWEQTSGEPVTITNPNSEMATFPAPSSMSQGFVLEFQLTVSDGTTSSTDSVVINVQPQLLPRLPTPTGGQVVGDRYSWNAVPGAERYRFVYNITESQVEEAFTTSTSINHPHPDPDSIRGLERVRAEATGFRPSNFLFF